MTVPPLPEHAPSPERLQREANGLRRDLDTLLELAAADHDHLAALAADLEQEYSTPAEASYRAAAARLRALERMLTRARCHLVQPSSQRYRAAQMTLEHLAELDRADAPWRAEAPTVTRTARAA